MVEEHKLSSVFVPTGLPTITYVDRGQRDLERKLRVALETPGLIVSLSGPSKSGKTVLIKRVKSPDTLIVVGGGSIKSPEDLWRRVLGWMESPSQITVTKSNSLSGEVAGKAATKGGLAKVIGCEVDLQGKVNGGTSTATSSTRGLSSIDDVVREIGESAFTIFIDDFHYMERETQQAVARQIKEAAEKGVHICTASVPHRSDDVVRSNSELRGRVKAIDFEYWSDSEVMQIPAIGFPALGLRVSQGILQRLARESFGSPQLMQSMCLELCESFGVFVSQVPAIDLTVSEEKLREVLQQTATKSDFSSLVDALHAGAKQRGTERKEFRFTDGSVGDVYRCILLAMAHASPRLSFGYDLIIEITRSVCEADAPTGSSVTHALGQMHKIAKDQERQSVILEWDENILDIADPYFLFYLRASARLATLGSVRRTS
jgi:hypothetical protein